jgi:hypothetical protein
MIERSVLSIPLLAAAAFAGAQALPAPSVAREGAWLEICLSEAADYSAVYPAKLLPAAGATREVAGVIRLGKGESHTTMTATWIAAEVPGTQPNFVINRIEMDLKGKDRAVTRFRHPQGLLAGKYRLEITAGKKPWRSAEFRVAPVAAPAVSRPADLLPLTPGTVWRYALTQEFGGNVRPTLPPGVKLDPDGRFRASTSTTVVKADASGALVETRQNNVLANEEWLRITDAGLVITRIRSGGEEDAFDPPHVLWPWPLTTPKEWFFEPDDKSYRQRFRMFGPVAIKGPAGEGPGYIVLMEQRSSDVALSVERQYMPGIGVVRETITQARNGVLLTRTESVLSANPSRAP